jgi:hypothetical protein
LSRADRPSSAGGSRPAAGTPDLLQQLLDELGLAKQRLLGETEALRAVDARVRSWDLGEAFLARRSRALRAEATVRFGEALDSLHLLLLRLSETNLRVAPRVLAGRAGTRRLLIAIRNELRYLQRAFDGGSLLLASTLASFSAPGS